MKATTGSMLLLITVGGLIVYLGQEALARREADVVAAGAQPAEQSSGLEPQMGVITQRQVELDARQGWLDTREAELARWQSELEQESAAIELERIAIQAEKDRQAQEEQGLKNLQADLQGKAANLDQREHALNSDRAQLDREKGALSKQQEQSRILLGVLYGLIAVTCATLLLIIWLAYHLVLR